MKSNTFEETLDGSGKRFAIVASRFNSHIVDLLIEGARAGFAKHGVTDVPLYQVPGAFEIPLCANKLAKTKKFDAIVCVGAVIRGETSHYDHICDTLVSGLLQTMLTEEVPVIFSVLTTENEEQAKARGPSHGTSGAQSAIEMANLMQEL